MGIQKATDVTGNSAQRLRGGAMREIWSKSARI